jgi:hypothetical protein
MSQMNDPDRRFEPVLTAMLERKADELRSPRRYWEAISDRMGEQDSRIPWDYVVDAMNKLRLPIRPRYAQTIGGALVVVVAALLLVLFLNTDDGQSGGSAPAISPGQVGPESGGAEPAGDGVAPVPTSTPAPTSTAQPTATATTVPPTATAVPKPTVSEPTATVAAAVAAPDVRLSAGVRANAVEFLRTYEEAGMSYTDTLWGDVVHWLGAGDIAGGLALWLIALEEFETVLTETGVPEEMTLATDIRATGLSMLEASRDWLGGINSKIEAGDWIEPLSLLVELETAFDSPERSQVLELKKEFRLRYKIDLTEVRDEERDECQQYVRARFVEVVGRCV